MKKISGNFIPDVVGTYGKAWRVKHKAVSAAAGKPVGATIAVWLIEAPNAHPFWCNYVLGCIHLRAVPGMNPPVINLEGATHEVFLYALDPEADIAPDQMTPWPILLPINYAGQFKNNDFGAEELMQKTVIDIVSGKLNPDTDARADWKARFGDSNFLKS